MFLRFLALPALLFHLAFSAAFADDLSQLSSRFKIASGVKYTPQNVYLALIRSFALREKNLSVDQVIDRYGNANCAVDLQKLEYQDNDWYIKSSWDPYQPNEIQVTLAGPARQISRYAPIGYELYVFQLLLFFDGQLELQPYIYYRTSRYNLRSLDPELLEPKHRDNVVMDPYPEWSNNFLPGLYSAISEVAEYRVQACLGQHEEEIQGE